MIWPSRRFGRFRPLGCADWRERRVAGATDCCDAPQYVLLPWLKYTNHQFEFVQLHAPVHTLTRAQTER